jgi:putative lipoic acid-binding regulatory protein
MSVFNGVQVFSATMFHQRQELGEAVTRWLEEARRTRPGFELVDMQIRQSSDEAFHCVSITVFFKETVNSEKKRRG